MASVSERFSSDRRERQARRHLDRTDFDTLADAGFLLTGVRHENGGLWTGVRESTRPVCSILRELAHGDSSVALVAAMHPAVLSQWLATPEVDPQAQAAWDEQTGLLEQRARDGAWFGTITSEPGSGGDVSRTRAVAEPSADGTSHLLTGDKHFGSGSGVTSFVMTTARPAGGDPDLFYMEVADVPWDGSRGVTLLREWDGAGMSATQSHALRFDAFPATRCAWPGHLADLSRASGPFVSCAFTAVIVGVVDAALAAAKEKMDSRGDDLRAWEQVEWTRVLNAAWTIDQVFEGMMRATEHEPAPLLSTLRGKTVAAELAESVLSGMCKVLGGGTFSASSPFSHWYEDVRALGFLRPPWGLAFDQLHEISTRPAE